METIEPPKVDDGRKSDVLDSELMNEIVGEHPSIMRSINDTPLDDRVTVGRKVDKSLNDSVEKDQKNSKDVKASHDEIEKEWKELEKELDED